MPIIYLSPSTQEYNLFVNGGNEEEVMNQIADAMIPYLRANGIRYSRNSPSGNVSASIAQSNAGNYDLHVAIHSNASPENRAGQLQGTDIYYQATNWRSKHFADILANNFKNIYPNPNMVDTRTTTSLSEVLRTRAPAVLIEVAYHDNPEDAAWIKENIDAIARTIVLSITEYFGLPFIQPGPAKTGTVNTGGPSLLIRDRPNTGSTVLGRIPNGAQVTVYGISPTYWFSIGYNGNYGFVSGDFVDIS